MGRGYEKHLIGEPVVPIRTTSRKRRFRYPPGDMWSNYRKIILRRSAIFILPMFLLPILILLPFIIMGGPAGIAFVCLIEGALIFCFAVAIPVGVIIGMRFLRKFNKAGIELHEDGMQVVSVYSTDAPEIMIKVPYWNIERVGAPGPDYWGRINRETPGWIKFLQGSPVPPPEALISIFSSPENLVLIELKRSIRIDRMVPPKTFRMPAVGTYNIHHMVVDIDRQYHQRFREEIEYRIMGGGPE
ncbi:MAG: hypothetical protein ACMUHB_01245 [Thermoplasmatota archaeon]